MEERTQDHNNTNDDISNDGGGNNDEAEGFKQAIDHEQETSDEERITIDDINIVFQMNSMQMAIGGGEKGWQPMHGYNLRGHPTRWKQQVLLAVAQGDNMKGVVEEGQYTTIHLKVHAHVMLTQMNIRYRLLALWEKRKQGYSKRIMTIAPEKGAIACYEAKLNI